MFSFLMNNLFFLYEGEMKTRKTHQLWVLLVWILHTLSSVNSCVVREERREGLKFNEFVFDHSSNYQCLLHGNMQRA